MFALVFALILIVDLVEHLRKASDNEGVATSTVVKLVLFHAPSLAEQVFPFAVLFGSMISFLMLSRTLELAVARASGLSVWQFAAPGAAFAGLLGLFATTVYSPFAAEMRANYDQLNVETLGGRASFMDTKRSGTWLRQKGADGESVIHAQSSSDLGVRLRNVTAYIYDQDDQLVERIDARIATLKPGRWQLNSVLVSRPGDSPLEFDTYIASTNLSPQQVREIFGSTESVAFWDLPRMIDASETAGLPARAFKLQYQALLAQPLTFIAMVFLAATVSLRIFRFGNLVRMILTGVVAGFMLYVVTQIVRDLGLSGVASPALASWLPAALAMLLSLTVLLYQEDG